MLKKTLCAAAGIACFAGAVLSSAAAGTMTYSGSGTYGATALTMPLSNGDTVYGAQNEGVVSISTDPPTILFSRCMGLGLIKVDNQFGADTFYCTFWEGEDHRFDVRGGSTDGQGTGDVIGGSGKWSGATGKMEFRHVSGAPGSGKFTFQLEITTP